MITTPSPRSGGRSARTALIAALAVVAALLLGAAPVAAEPPVDPSEAGRHAAAWVAAQVDAGLPLENFGAPDWGVTLDAALGLAATGTGGTQLAAIWQAMVAERDAVAAPFGDDNPGRLARMILLARALGEDPNAVGSAPGADLVGRLASLRQVSGPDAGLFGTAPATFDGAFRQGYSLVALSVSGAPIDPSSIAWLESQQCADGAWMPYRSDLSAPCAFDPARFVGPDSNSTAVALAALTVVAESSPSIEPGVAWLLSVRGDDGGWGFYPGDASEPSSTAFAAQVLIAVGGHDEAVAAARAVLVGFQLGCDTPADDRGALTFPGTNDAPNLFSTSQALPALAGLRIDAAPPAIVAGVEPLDCSPAPEPLPTTPDPATPERPAPIAGPSTPGQQGLPDTEVLGTTQQPAAAAVASATPVTRELAFTGRYSGELSLLGFGLLAAGLLLGLVGRRSWRA